VDCVKLWRPAGKGEAVEIILREGRVKARRRGEGENLTVFQRLEAMDCALLLFGPAPAE
jgi:hypothetical protein